MFDVAFVLVTAFAFVTVFQQGHYAHALAYNLNGNKASYYPYQRFVKTHSFRLYRSSPERKESVQSNNRPRKVLSKRNKADKVILTPTTWRLYNVEVLLENDPGKGNPLISLFYRFLCVIVIVV